MGRWQPDAKGRLREAALELYAEKGFEQTTVADIATRAGVTERTFFRYFADKREVLFGGTDALRATAISAIAESTSGTAMDRAGAAVIAAASILDGQRDHARRRQSAILANPSLQERELLKMAALASDIATALREKGIGVDDLTARLAGQSAATAFGVAFERWIADGEHRAYPVVVAECLAQLRAVASA
ncbi:TetR family transcriptional regulator [Schumannella luteola]